MSNNRNLFHAAGRLVALGLTVMAMTAHAQTVSGPIPGHITLGQGAFDHPPAGYVVEEYFLSGTATAYAMATPPGPNGEWRAQAAGSAPYKTRLVVARPIDPARFNGTAVVEWLNVTAGTDGAPDWNFTHRELVRRGYAYVGVSVQKVGLDGSPMAMPGMLSVKKADPARYGSLEHPGDAYAYDIYSQAGRAVRGGGAGGILGPLKPERVIATGESQSAAFMTTYVNAVDPLAKVFDGFLIHSRFKGAAPLDGDFMSSMRAGPGSVSAENVQIRADMRVPVLMFITETDLMTPMFGYLPSRQPDTPRIHTWEVAGTSHADTYIVSGSAIDDGSASAEALAKAFTPVDNLFGQQLGKPMNAAPQHHYVMEAAISALDHWVRTGEAPPPAPRLKVNDAAPPALVTDAVGNAVGGIRSPWVDVPTSKLSGLGQTGGGLMALFGSTEPFDAAKLAALYPGGRQEYLKKFDRALASAIEAGFILRADKAEIQALAAAMYPANVSAAAAP
jgi:hypothetical protein